MPRSAITNQASATRVFAHVLATPALARHVEVAAFPLPRFHLEAADERQRQISSSEAVFISLAKALQTQQYFQNLEGKAKRPPD